MKTGQICAYCGGLGSTTDHVIPSALYPLSKSQSRVQRIVVPCCTACNAGWSNDEAHFRNVLLLCGEANPVVHELWEGKTRRSFDEVDGHRRVRDVVEQMVAVETPQGERHKIYPSRDPRVMRIVCKIVRGLCHHHNLRPPVSDDQVWADAERYAVPPGLFASMTVADAEKDILEYSFSALGDDPDMHSFWLLRFFERAGFFGVVYRSAEAQERLRSGTSIKAEPLPLVT